MLGVVAPPPLHIESPKFEGSLATLFVCVKTQKVDLRDIPLLPICEAYLAYMLGDPEMNIDEAAAALAALSYLIERKAFLLLPVQEGDEEEEPDGLEGLPAATIFEFKTAIESLRLWHEQRSNLFFRAPNQGPNPYELPYEIEDLAPSSLAVAFKRLIERARPLTSPSVSRVGRSLALEMRRVLMALSYEFKTLDRLVPLEATKEDAVYWFLSILELMRLGQAAARIVGNEVEFGRA